ncbi:unnamed protein product [Thlaspi arvense]|uniref:Uncharacterized protein n=1 Tax=Thlaspi arvense TaxID=13288 RepID=A0AAU9SH43_THLAR|nr:unnamed protein product [Thlaspi arvense]
MAKLSCSYFLVLMLVFSACLIVESAEGKLCHITVDKRMFCEEVHCRQSCFSGYNGIGTCFDDPKVAGSLNCGCSYNC